MSVIIAVLDEGEHIDDVMADLLGQDYTGPYEVIVADGGSVDGTREKLEAWASRDPRVKVIANPQRRQAPGLNHAAAEATGEFLVRADGHTRFASDYVSASVRVVRETGGAVGGRMYPEGRTRFGRAVAAAMLSPLTMGPGRFHHATGREEVDTVYLGIFPRDAFLELGGLRSFPSGTSEDADFYFRWRKNGGKVYVDPSIVSRYTPRDSAGALWRQYFRYGMGKAEMLWANGRLPSWRPLAPLGLVLGLVSGAVLGVVANTWWPLLLLLVSWVAILTYAPARIAAPVGMVMAAAGIMHLSYGFGMLLGLVPRKKGPHVLTAMSPSKWSRLLRLSLAGALWIVLIAAVATGWNDLKDDVFRLGGRFPVAIALGVVGHLAGAIGWSQLIKGRPAQSVVGYLASQPAKYLPVGGVAQAAGQVGLTTSSRQDRGTVGVAFIIHVLVQMLAASSVALLSILGDATPRWVPGLLAVFISGCAFSVRPSVARTLLNRLGGRFRGLRSVDELPTSSAIVRSLIWTSVPVVMTGLAFAILLHGVSTSVSVPVAVGTFAAAWLAGFLAFPLPSGVGIRELVLIGLLPSLGAVGVIGVALVHRFAILLSEVVLYLAVNHSLVRKQALRIRR